MRRHRLPSHAVMIVVLLAAACGTTPASDVDATPANATPEAISLLGRELFPPVIDDDVRGRMEEQLAEARAAWEASPDDPDAIIWLGRRTAYLGRYRDAIGIYDAGIIRFPSDPRLYRHRGHRHISLRDFPRAIADLEQAAALVDGQADQVEPDGQPNARGIPTSTLHSNIYYHLALARYLSGDFPGAAAGWTRARGAVDNPDNLVAASHWLYLSLRRAGDEAAASAVLERISGDLDVIENTSYHSLLMMYRGERTPEDLLADVADGASGSAVTYGVGAWLMLDGRQDDALEVWRGMVEQPDWASFGHIAAEVELARVGTSSTAVR